MTERHTIEVSPEDWARLERLGRARSIADLGVDIPPETVGARLLSNAIDEETAGLEAWERALRRLRDWGE